jgi:sirohydrochlorin ferrochelatase
MRTGFVVFAHGSSVTSANEAVRAVAADAARLGNWDLFETAFLECAPPDLAAGVAKVVAQGATRVLVVPYFLTLGIHLQRDLPRIITQLSSIHPGVEIRVTPPLDGHPALAQILSSRAEEGLETWRNRE